MHGKQPACRRLGVGTRTTSSEVVSLIVNHILGRWGSHVFCMGLARMTRLIRMDSRNPQEWGQRVSFIYLGAETGLAAWQGCVVHKSALSRRQVRGSLPVR